MGGTVLGADMGGGMSPRVLEVFAGVGGLALAWHRSGARHVGMIEVEPFPRRILARHFPDVPQWNDVTTVRALDLPYCDVLSGGPPC